MKRKTTNRRYPFLNADEKEIIKLNREIEHLRGRIKKDCSNSCIICKSKPKYSEKYDSHYCPKCLRWNEPICGDRGCDYCRGRPKYPRKNQT